MVCRGRGEAQRGVKNNGINDGLFIRILYVS